MEDRDDANISLPTARQAAQEASLQPDSSEEGLRQEIAMYRSLIRRLADWIDEIQTLEQHERMVSLMGMAVVRLANLLRTQKTLEIDRASKWERDIQQAIQELTQDWHL